MSKTLDLKVRFKALGDLAERFSGSTKALKKLQNGLKATGTELRQLKDTERKAARFSALKNKLGEDSKALDAAQASAKALERQIKSTSAPTDEMRREFDKARAAVKRLDAQQDKHRKQLGEVRSQLKGAGFDTSKFAQSNTELKSKVERANKALSDQAAQLERVTERQKRLNKTRERLNNLQGKVVGAAKYGAAAVFGAGAAAAGVGAAVDQSTQEDVRARLLAKSVGIKQKSLESYAGSVKAAGFDADHVIDLVEELNNKMGESAGSEAVNAVTDGLGMLGLQYERIKRLSPEQQFEAIYDAALKAKDQQQAASAVDMIMGGESNKILGVWRQTGMSMREILAAQEALNFRTEQGRAGAEAYQKQISRLKAAAGSVKAEFFGQLGGALAGPLERLNKWVAANKELINVKVTEYAQRFARGLETVVTHLPQIVQWLKRAAVAFGAFMVIMAALKTYITIMLALNLAAGSGIGVMRGLGTSVLWLGKALRTVAMFMAANPILIAIMLWATAAYLIYKNWAPIKEFFIGLWSSATQAMSKAKDQIVSKMQALFDWFSSIKERFTGYGRDLVNGLINGVTERFGAIQDRISSLASAVKGKFASLLGIRSPSRVFMRYGGDLGDGLSIGISKRAGEVLKSVQSLGGKLKPAAVSAVQDTVRVTAQAVAPVQPFSNPALAGHGRAGSIYNITVPVAPGMDAQAVARAVAAELDLRERRLAARGRSAMYDV